MSGCNHISIVDVVGDRDVSLYETGRFNRVICGLPNPAEQYPNVVHFIGKTNKNLALKYLFPQNNFRGTHPRNDATNLRVDTTSIDSNAPLFITDSDSCGRMSAHLGWNFCHQAVAHTLSWSPTVDFNIADTLQARLHFLFSDVICLFVDDFSSLDEVATRITRWVRIGSASNLSKAIRPRLILITSEKTLDKSFIDLRLEEFRHELYETCGDTLAEVFSELKIIQLGGEHLSDLARHYRLKEIIINNTREMSMLRQKHHVAFSALHVEAFFTAAVQHLAKTVNTPFNHIEVSRAFNQVGGDLSYHLHTFLDLGITHKIPYDQLTSYIGSALLMNAYPPEMHIFDTNEIFSQLYRRHCYNAFEKVGKSESFAIYRSHQVQKNMATLSEELRKGDCRSSHLHIQNIRHRNRQWPKLKSNVTCLFCLSRSPGGEVLSCGHSMCCNCIRIFGLGVSGMEQTFMLTECILCQDHSSLIVSLKPPTAGIRVLSIDGGGTRGVLPLQHMVLLQEALGDYALNDLFDLAVGTSSGGFIVLALCSLGWDVGKCNTTFETLARQVFGEKQVPRHTIFGRTKEWLSWWVADGKHDPELLESTLQDQFGPNRPMFGTCVGKHSATRVAVTATSISDATPFVFTNYNGVREVNMENGYNVIRPQKVDEEPFLWEAARATSAAPGLYPPVYIRAIGGALQDGALKHNNPIELALWESRRIWPENLQPENPWLHNHLPDVVVSLGTGTESRSGSRHAPDVRHIFNDSFVHRTWESFKSLLDGERVYKNLMNHFSSPTKSHFFRLNPDLPQETVIDDTSVMGSLRRIVKKSPECIEVARALLTSDFYFELREKSWHAGQYRCYGTIRCRGQSHLVIQQLQRLGLTRLEFVSDLESLGSCALQHDICALCHCYRRPVTFVVRHLDEVFSLYLKGEGFKRRLGGSPSNINWYIRQQGFDLKFGNADHGSMGLLQCAACERVTMGFEMPKRGCEVRSEKASKKPRLKPSASQDATLVRSAFT